MVLNKILIRKVSNFSAWSVATLIGSWICNKVSCSEIFKAINRTLTIKLHNLNLDVLHALINVRSQICTKRLKDTFAQRVIYERCQFCTKGQFCTKTLFIVTPNPYPWSVIFLFGFYLFFFIWLFILWFIFS